MSQPGRLLPNAYSVTLHSVGSVRMGQTDPELPDTTGGFRASLSGETYTPLHRFTLVLPIGRSSQRYAVGFHDGAHDVLLALRFSSCIYPNRHIAVHAPSKLARHLHFIVKLPTLYSERVALRTTHPPPTLLHAQRQTLS